MLFSEIAFIRLKKILCRTIAQLGTHDEDQYNKSPMIKSCMDLRIEDGGVVIVSREIEDSTTLAIST